MKTVSNSVVNSATIANQGTPRVNQLFLNGLAGAAIAAGDYCTITDGVTSDIYEFRASTPPAGGTAGRIWVYQGANAAASRANLVKAINGTVDANVVTRTSATNTIKVTAAQCATGNSVVVWETTAIGNSIGQTTVVGTLQGTENLTEAADVWNALNFPQYGAPSSSMKIACCRIGITAAMIAQGSLDFVLPFSATYIALQNCSRQQDEAITINSDVYLALASGASPHNQANDVIQFLAFGV